MKSINRVRTITIILHYIAYIVFVHQINVLSGFVTDHVGLLQERSKLYHYLAVFEPDVKRRLDMENRRVEMLQLGSLNKSVFEILHKQLSYELGEAYLALLDVKLDKSQCRAGGDVNESSLK